MMAIKLIVLLAGTSGITWVSRRSLQNPRSHVFFGSSQAMIRP